MMEFAHHMALQTATRMRGLALFALAGLPTVALQAATVPRIDAFGQAADLQYQGKVSDSGALRVEADEEWRKLSRVGRDAIRFDAHGGFRGHRLGLEATGFFRVTEIKGRSWLVTPEGNPFFLIGCDSVNWQENGYSTPMTENGVLRKEFAELPDRDETPEAYHLQGRINFLAANLRRKYGADFDRRLDEVIRRRILDWGFNSTAKWGWGKKLEGVPYFEDSMFPGCKFGDEPAVVDMYHPDFKNLADSLARKCAGRCRKDRDLIAYACDNENGWRQETFGAILSRGADECGGFAKSAFLDHVARSRGVEKQTLVGLGPEGFTRDEKSEFIRRSSALYHGTVRDAFRRYDPNHMFMGASICFPGHADWMRGALPFVDLVGLHEYSVEHLSWFRKLLPELEKAGKPFAVLEFSFVGAEKGYGPFGQVTCCDQRSRGLCYRHYTEHVAMEPLCLGFGWFIFFDQPLAGRSVGGEAQNFGLVSQQDRPYTDLVEEVRKSNARLYALHSGECGEPFTVNDFTGVLKTPASIYRFMRMFLPGSVPSYVRSDPNDINPKVLARFNGHNSRITFKDGTKGLAWFGVLSRKSKGGVVANYSCWNGLADAPVRLPVEWSKDGESFVRAESRVQQTWRGEHFTEYAVHPALPAEARFVRVGGDLREGSDPWAILLYDIREGEL